MAHSRTRTAALALALVSTLFVLIAPASAATVPRVRLDGKPSSVSRATKHHCLASEPGALDCYTSRATRDRAVSGGANAQLLLSGYVIAYHDIAYGGASVVLASDYSNLGSIGWNDRISSYKVYTSPTGQFYKGTGYGGGEQSFCCYTNVSYVGDAYNDTFSSVNIP